MRVLVTRRVLLLAPVVAIVVAALVVAEIVEGVADNVAAIEHPGGRSVASIADGIADLACVVLVQRVLALRHRLADASKRGQTVEIVAVLLRSLSLAELLRSLHLLAAKQPPLGRGRAVKLLLALLERELVVR